MGNSPARMDDKGVFLATGIEIRQARDLGPKVYFGQAFELSPLVAVNVGVVDVICAHDLFEFFVLESVLSTFFKIEIALFNRSICLVFQFHR